MTEKLYYTIGEVAKMLEVKSSLIRFWEQEIKIIKPKKNSKGYRIYTKEDIQKLKLVYHLVRERGMTLKGAEQKVKDGRTEAEMNLDVVNRLKNVRETLLALKKQIDTTP